MYDYTSDIHKKLSDLHLHFSFEQYNNPLLDDHILYMALLQLPEPFVLHFGRPFALHRSISFYQHLIMKKNKDKVLLSLT